MEVEAGYVGFTSMFEGAGFRRVQETGRGGAPPAGSCVSSSDSRPAAGQAVGRPSNQTSSAVWWIRRIRRAVSSIRSRTAGGSVTSATAANRVT